MGPQEFPRVEKPRLKSSDHIHGFCNKLFEKIKELFDIEISPKEVVAFAEANDCFEDAVPLAEHICLVLIEAVQNQQAAIFGMREELRAQLAAVVEITEPTAFDGLHIPQKQRNPKIFGLAVRFLNGKI